MDRNLRTVRERLIALVGKKVTLGTSDNHYISGVIQEVDGARARLTVAGESVSVPTRNIVNVVEAASLQAEYVK